MDPFYHGPLRRLTEELREGSGSGVLPRLPQAFADPTPTGTRARQLLTELSGDLHEVLASYLTKKVEQKKWVRSAPNQEVVKAVLDELSACAPRAAQQLGLAFCESLTQVKAPWMRILAHLTVAEIISRNHAHSSACAMAYLHTFANVQTYLEHGLRAERGRPSLFNPVTLSNGDLRRARSIVLETVLPYGEEAMRLLWGLQARAQRDGEDVQGRIFRIEEVDLAARLRGWLQDVLPSDHPPKQGWQHDLLKALARSQANEGPASSGFKDTPRAQAVTPLVQDIETLLRDGDLNKAEQDLVLLHRSLSKDRDLEHTTIKNHLLHLSYLRAVVTYRQAIFSYQQCDEATFKDKVSNLFFKAEAVFDDTSCLWSGAVMQARRRAFEEIPAEWRAPISTSR
jgi:hypothetical protein